MKGVKFNLVFETTTKNGHKTQLKFHVPPSKHLGLINFLKMATEDDKNVQFTIEKVTPEKKESSKTKGIFHLEEEKA